MKVPPPVLLWSCGLGPVVMVYRGFEQRYSRGFTESSWFWEVIDMAFSQMATIPWEGLRTRSADAYSARRIPLYHIP